MFPWVLVAHYDIHGWRAAYADPRDFLDFFLVRNEYGTHLPDLPALSQENAEIVASIVDVCRRYRDEVFAELDGKEMGQETDQRGDYAQAAVQVTAFSG